MRDNHETPDHQLLDFYQQLEACRKYRDQLAIYLLLYGAGLTFLLTFPNRLFRMGGVGFYYMAVVVIVIFMAVSGLLLLAAFIRNNKDIRAIKAEIKANNQPPPKRKRKRGKRKRQQEPRYAVGDDGELVPLPLDEDSDRADYADYEEADPNQQRRS